MHEMRLTGNEGAPLANVGLGGGVSQSDETVGAVLVDIEGSVINGVCNDFLHQSKNCSALRISCEFAMHLVIFSLQSDLSSERSTGNKCGAYRVVEGAVQLLEANVLGVADSDIDLHGTFDCNEAPRQHCCQI